jgi:hypothetical protein
MPKFSIVATDYENHVPRDRMIEGIESLNNQTFKDFELLVVHDGPKNIPYSEEISKWPENTKFLNTEKHYGVYENSFGRKCGWGHHSRKLGINSASGEYIVNFNIDNLLNRDCLLELNNESERNNPDIMIFPIEYRGVEKNYILKGLPPITYSIDLIQCVAKKTAWDSIGGFSIYSAEADGILIEKLTTKYQYSYIDKILGINR